MKREPSWGWIAIGAIPLSIAATIFVRMVREGAFGADSETPLACALDLLMYLTFFAGIGFFWVAFAMYIISSVNEIGETIRKAREGK